MTRDTLFGCYYPIKDLDNKVVGVRSIKAAYELENAAGYAVSVVSSTPITLFIIGYAEAANLSRSTNGLTVLDIEPRAEIVIE